MHGHKKQKTSTRAVCAAPLLLCAFAAPFSCCAFYQRPCRPCGLLRWPLLASTHTHTHTRTARARADVCIRLTPCRLATCGCRAQGRSGREARERIRKRKRKEKTTIFSLCRQSVERRPSIAVHTVGTHEHSTAHWHVSAAVLWGGPMHVRTRGSRGRGRSTGWPAVPSFQTFLPSLDNFGDACLHGHPSFQLQTHAQKWLVTSSRWAPARAQRNTTRKKN